jgi:hypothetical protein
LPFFFVLVFFYPRQFLPRVTPQCVAPVEPSASQPQKKRLNDFPELTKRARCHDSVSERVVAALARCFEGLVPVPSAVCNHATGARRHCQVHRHAPREVAPEVRSKQRASDRQIPFFFFKFLYF